MKSIKPGGIQAISLLSGVILLLLSMGISADDGGNDFSTSIGIEDRLETKSAFDEVKFQEDLNSFFDGWTITYDQGCPESITISGKSLFIRDIADISTAPLADVAEAIKNQLKPVIDFDRYGLVAERLESFGRFTGITFRQKHNDIPVETEGVRAVISKSGALIFLKINLADRIDISTIPTLRPHQAVASAFADFKNGPHEEAIEQNDLVIYVDNSNKCHLAYKIVAVVENPAMAWKIFVDAGTGEIIEQIDITNTEEIIPGVIMGNIYTECIIDDQVVHSGMANSSYVIEIVEGDDPDDPNGGKSSIIIDRYANDNGHYAYAEAIGGRTERVIFEMGNRVTRIKVEDSPESGNWYNPSWTSDWYDMNGGAEYFLDYDYTDFTGYYSTTQFHEASTIAFYVRDMDIYFFDIIGEGMLGREHRRETFVRDFTLPEYPDPKLGYSGGGSVLGFAPFFGASYEDLFHEVVYHEMAHSVMFHNIYYALGVDIPGYWGEAPAYYFSHSHLGTQAPSNHLFYPATKDNPHFVQDEVHEQGKVLSGTWWQIQNILNDRAYTDSMVFWSTRFDISSYGHCMQSMLLIDDDDGDLANGTPNSGAIRTAYYDHWIGPERELIFFRDNVLQSINPTMNVVSHTPHEYSIYENYPYDNVVWDPGDGTPTQNGLTINHTYTSGGTYDLSCKVFYPWGMTESIATINVEPCYVLTLSNGEGCSGAHFRIDLSLDNQLPAEYISLPIRYDGDVGLVFDSVSQAETRSDGMTVTLNTDLPQYYFRQYLIEGNGAVSELPAGDGVILKLYFTASGVDDLLDNTSIRLEEFGGIYPRVIHGDIDDEAVTYPGGYTVTYFPGDANGDGGVNVGDAVYIINYLDVEDPGPAPDPIESADANCDGDVTIDDASFIVAFVFSGGPAPECCSEYNPLKMANESPPDGLPGEFSLSQNYPNPFNPRTNLDFNIPVASHVKLSIYNIAGQRVATVADSYFEAGHHSVVWDGSSVASGMYFYRIEAGEFKDTRKMILLK